MCSARRITTPTIVVRPGIPWCWWIDRNFLQRLLATLFLGHRLNNARVHGRLVAFVTLRAVVVVARQQNSLFLHGQHTATGPQPYIIIVTIDTPHTHTNSAQPRAENKITVTLAKPCRCDWLHRSPPLLLTHLAHFFSFTRRIEAICKPLQTIANPAPSPFTHTAPMSSSATW